MTQEYAEVPVSPDLHLGILLLPLPLDRAHRVAKISPTERTGWRKSAPPSAWATTPLTHHVNVAYISLTKCTALQQ